MSAAVLRTIITYTTLRLSLAHLTPAARVPVNDNRRAA